MHKLVKKSETTPRQINPQYAALNYITKEVTPLISLAVTEGNNLEDIITTNENRIYFVLEGTLILTFDNEQVVLHKDDSCFIAAGTSYTMKGTFRSVIVNQPAFGVK